MTSAKRPNNRGGAAAAKKLTSAKRKIGFIGESGTVGDVVVPAAVYCAFEGEGGEAVLALIRLPVHNERRKRTPSEQALAAGGAHEKPRLPKSGRSETAGRHARDCEGGCRSQVRAPFRSCAQWRIAQL